MYARLTFALMLAFITSVAWGDGFDDYYEVRAADIDGNGYQDLYVSPSPNIVLVPVGDIITPIVTNGAPDIAPFALLQLPDGSFQIDGSLSQSQHELGSSGANLGIALQFADYNADGYTDLYTGRLDLLDGFAYANPVFVYAPTTPGGAPTQLSVVDDDFVDFFVEVSGALADPDYLTITRLVNGWYTVETGDEVTGWWDIRYIDTWYTFDNSLNFLDDDDDPLDPNSTPFFCETYPQYCDFDYGVWLVYGTFTENNQLVLDDPEERFNDDALDFIEHLPAIQNDTNTIARDVLEGVLGNGVQVGGAYQAALDDSQETTEIPASHHPFIDTMISFGNVAAALFRDIDLEDIKETAQVAGEVFVPGFDLYVCATQGGCSAFDIAMGVVGVVPAGKVVTGAVKIGAVGGRTAVRIGQKAEDLVRNAPGVNIGSKPSPPLKMNGRDRVPDGVTTTTVTEIKNRAKQSYSRQLRDYVDWTKQQNPPRMVDLYVRGKDGFEGSGKATELSGPLWKAICAGDITLKAIPGTGDVPTPPAGVCDP